MTASATPDETSCPHSRVRDMERIQQLLGQLQALPPGSPSWCAVALERSFLLQRVFGGSPRLNSLLNFMRPKSAPQV
jgi:hypothetical protein